MKMRPEQWMSHELRTLLSLMAAPLDRLEQRYGDDPDGLDLLGALRGYMEVIGRLGDSLMDGSGESVSEMVVETMAPATTVRHVADQLRPMALEFGLAFDVVATAAATTPVSADVSRFTRFLSTLIELSIRRTLPPGHVSVSVDAPLPGELLVTVESAQARNDVALPLTTRVASVERALAQLGGRLDTYDVALGGTVFELVFPVGEATAGETVAPPASTTTRLVSMGSTVDHSDLRAPVAVVVDDEPHILAVWVQTLRRRFRVHAASNGLEALELIRRFRPDVILTDNVMPLVNGPELIAAVRADSSVCRTPIVAVTACVTPDLRWAMQLDGPGVTLVKPVRPLELLNRVTALAEARRAEKSALAKEHLDPLTGLLTGARLRAEMEHTLKGPGAALVVTDLQRFHQVNDLYGRLVGDQVLARVADVLRMSVREIDKVARIGDDEFAVLLVNVDEGEASLVAERIARAITQVHAEEVAGAERIVTTRLRATVAVTVARADDSPDLLLRRGLAELERSQSQRRAVAA